MHQMQDLTGISWAEVARIIILQEACMTVCEREEEGGGRDGRRRRITINCFEVSY